MCAATADKREGRAEGGTNPSSISLDNPAATLQHVMTSILCLAHYCDVHGPTPIMVTEGFPAPCTLCFQDAVEVDQQQTSTAAAHAPSVTDSLRKMTLNLSRSSSSPASEKEAQAQRAALRKSKLAGTKSATRASPKTASAMETPPQSPGISPEMNSDKTHMRRDSSFYRTYDEQVTKRAIPCQSCALTLPKRTESSNGTTTPDEPRGPTLRSRTPYARVYGGSNHTSPPTSNPQSSCASDAEDEACATIRPSANRRPTMSTSQSSISSMSSLNTHTHYLDYISMHEPQIATTYSIIRAACLRTLSFETLPRRPEHGYGSNNSSKMSSPVSSVAPSLPPYTSPPTSISSNPGYISASSAPQSAAAGAIFFGDPIAGYTTAYIFRIPDMHARGRKRVYAFLALSTHREHIAMRAFQFMHARFRELAIWIQDLAEAAQEREREEENSPIGRYGGPYGGGAFGAGAGPGPRDSGVGLGLGGGSFDFDRDRDRDHGSSFLTGGSRSGYMQRMGMGGSMGPGGFAPKARGLAELVGLPDFFIQLHKRFVELSFELGVVLGS